MEDDADGLFGHLTDEVAERVVAALREAHRIGLRTQAASEHPRRFGYGSTWPSRHDRLVAHLADLPGARSFPVAGRPYRLVEIGGRLLVPVHLADALADVAAAPQVGPDARRDLGGHGVPVTASAPTLFDPPGTAPTPPRPGAGPDPVLVGVVCHAGTPDLVAVLWGAVRAIDPDGHVDWSPERLPLPTAPPTSPTAPESAPESAPGPTVPAPRSAGTTDPGRLYPSR